MKTLFRRLFILAALIAGTCAYAQGIPIYGLQRATKVVMIPEASPYSRICFDGDACNWSWRYNSANNYIELITSGIQALNVDAAQNLTLAKPLNITAVSGDTVMPSLAVGPSAGGRIIWVGTQNNLAISGGNGAGQPPTITASGIDANVSLVHSTRGTGTFCFQSALGTTCTAPNGYIASGTPFTLSSFYINGPVAGGGVTYEGIVLPARPFTVVALRFYNSTASSGAGTTTLRVTDGTNNCDFAMSCAIFSGNIPIRQASTSGTCAFAASASLTYVDVSSTCATTQPAIKGTVDVEGNWQ